MTQKELLYVEDAIAHEQSIIKILDNTINELDDEELVTFIKKETKKHHDMEEKLINLLEESLNE